MILISTSGLIVTNNRSNTTYKQQSSKSLYVVEKKLWQKLCALCSACTEQMCRLDTCSPAVHRAVWHYMQAHRGSNSTTGAALFVHFQQSSSSSACTQLFLLLLLAVFFSLHSGPTLYYGSAKKLEIAGRRLISAANAGQKNVNFGNYYGSEHRGKNSLCSYEVKVVMCIQHTPAPNAAPSHTHTHFYGKNLKKSTRGHTYICVMKYIALRSRGAYSSIFCFWETTQKSFSDSPLTAMCSALYYSSVTFSESVLQSSSNIAHARTTLFCCWNNKQSSWEQ